ncbi:MAG: DUF72 domain-containing protein [Myxococcales bacterium]
MARPQLDLFELAPPQLEAAAVPSELSALGAALPSGVRFGTMSWTYPGWKGIVYGPDVVSQRLAAHGLTAYAKHPLLRCVEIDRTYYEPMSEEELRVFATQVPEDFRFVVKAHEDCTVRRFPTHARYGKKRGLENPRYLDSAYASEFVLGPCVRGLGSKLGVVLFQFSPEESEPPGVFAERLRDFLRRLPREVPCAVELRNPQLFDRAYAQALADAGALHCHNVWGAMPSALKQASRIPPSARKPLVIRWLMREGDSYQDAEARCAPFDRIVREDEENRLLLARLVAKAHAHDVPAYVLVDNKAEGSAPHSIVRLAGAFMEHCHSPP